MEPRDRTFAEVARWRRSVRSYTGEAVSRELVREIVAEAHLAPSSMNTQPWRFVVVQGERLDAYDEVLGGNAGKVRAAGTVVFIVADLDILARDERAAAFYDGTTARTPDAYAARNGGLVAMALLLSAASHGVASLPMIGFDVDRLREVAALGADEQPVIAIALGWPGADHEPGGHDRRPVDEVLRFDV